MLFSLYAESSNYILPDNVPANEFLNLKATSYLPQELGSWLHEYLEEFPNQQDVLRYITAMHRKPKTMILLGKIFKRKQQ